MTGITQFVYFCVGDRKRRGAKEAYEGEIVGGIGDGGEGIEQVADFGSVIEAASRDGDEGNARRFKRGFVDREGGGGTKEERHVAPCKSIRFVKFAQAVGEGFRGGLASFIGIFSQAEMKFNERRLDGFVFGFLAVGTERREGDEVGTRGVVGFAEDGSQKRINGFKQRLVGAEGEVEVNERAACGLDIGLDLAEDGDIGLTEAIDGLFGVADDEEIYDF